MATSEFTCDQLELLYNALRRMCTPEVLTSGRGQAPGDETTVPEGFTGSHQSGFDPENEVIFDPESEVIFDPENEVIFDGKNIIDPDDGEKKFNISKPIYDSYGHKINVKECIKDFVKLLYWVYVWEDFNQRNRSTSED